MRRLRVFAGLVAAVSVVAAGCTSGSGGGSTAGANTPLVISDVTGANWNCEFNPLNFAAWPQGGPSETGVIYEPLMFENLLTQKVNPWLATAYKWSNNLKTLTFTIRKGVKFSDGTPMTPADVAFTFNLIKKVPALDVNSVWSVLSSVTQSGDNVVMTFKSPSVPYFYYIADQIPIVPEHIWSKIC